MIATRSSEARGTCSTREALCACDRHPLRDGTGSPRRPIVLLYGGLIAPGSWRDNDVTIQMSLRLGAHAAGDLSDEELPDLGTMQPRSGACGGQFTPPYGMAYGCSVAHGKHEVRPRRRQGGVAEASGARGQGAGARPAPANHHEESLENAIARAPCGGSTTWSYTCAGPVIAARARGLRRIACGTPLRCDPSRRPSVPPRSPAGGVRWVRASRKPPCCNATAPVTGHDLRRDPASAERPRA